MELSQHVRAILSFVEAADAGSFTAASRKLKISSAAVSKNIANLERILGIRLMNRTTRQISLTTEGAILREHARIALSALDDVVDILGMEKNEKKGIVRISTSAAFGANYVVPALPEFISKYSNMSLDIDLDDRVIDLVNDGYDIAIRGGRIIDSTLVSRSICNIDLILVASPAYLQEYGVPKTADDLKNHKLIGRKFLAGKISPWEFKSSDGSITALEPTNAQITISEPESLAHLASLGYGVAQVGTHNALNYLEKGELKVILLDKHMSGNYEMVIQYPHRALIAPRVQITVDFLLDKLRNNVRLNVPLKSIIKYKA